MNAMKTDSNSERHHWQGSILAGELRSQCQCYVKLMPEKEHRYAYGRLPYHSSILFPSRRYGRSFLR